MGSSLVMTLPAGHSTDGREDPTHTHTNNADSEITRASHEQRQPPESAEKQRREKERTTLAEHGRHSCGPQASQRDKKQEHNKTLD